MSENIIEGIGTDIIEIRRIQDAIERHGDRFLQRIFTEKELAYCRAFAHPIPHFAGRFAAKEAIVKALGTGFKDISWSEVEILSAVSGRPEVFLSTRLKERFVNARIFLSISHCNDYATATAICVTVI